MKPLRLWIALVGLALAASVATVAAQPASAIGNPLPGPDLPVGTVTVRVVDGAVTSPAVGVDATLLVNGQPRIARTDASGRASFVGLPVGATVQAKVSDLAGKDMLSTTFPVPASGGTKVMLSRKPFAGMGGGGAAAAGPAGAGGMPEARAMSGQPRPERADPAGTYTVRVTYNALTMIDGRLQDPAPPVGVPVSLVGYSADDTVKVQTAKVDADGLVRFTDLDQSGGTAYYVLSQLPRNNATDRLISLPVQPDGQAGIRLVLSGDKRDATSLPIDDYARLSKSDGSSTPTGKVRIELDGVSELVKQVTLFDAATAKPIATAKPESGPGNPSDTINGSAQFDPSPQAPPGSLEVDIRGGEGTSGPLEGIDVQLIKAADKTPLPGATAKTDASGKANFKVTTDGDVIAVVTLHGKPMDSDPMPLASAGGTLKVVAQWSTVGRPQVVFEVPHVPGQVLYAQTSVDLKSGPLLCRSLPFQTVPETGTRAAIFVYPRTMFGFQLRAYADDLYFGVQGTWTIQNFSWTPFRASPDGLSIPLPAGHVGIVVGPNDQETVSIEQGKGFRIVRPIGPGKQEFLGKFSLPIKDGSVEWRHDLPYGTYQSQIAIRQSEGMTVKLPERVVGETRLASTDEPWFVIPEITIGPKQSMVLTIHGLPAEASWKGIGRKLIGVIALLVMIGGVVFALRRKSSPPEVDAAARRAKLMDELVALEHTGPRSNTAKRREQLIAELERIWGG